MSGRKCIEPPWTSSYPRINYWIVCLKALYQISGLMDDPDKHLFPSLLEGVPTGFQGDIPDSNVFSMKQEETAAEKPDLSIHLSNWHSAESNPAVTEELIQAELDKGWLITFPGTVDDAKTEWPCGVAIEKLGVAFSDSRAPQLVVDSTVCGANGSCEIKEHQQLPICQRCSTRFSIPW